MFEEPLETEVVPLSRLCPGDMLASWNPDEKDVVMVVSLFLSENVNWTIVTVAAGSEVVKYRVISDHEFKRVR